jgi:hypothetical protein
MGLYDIGKTTTVDLVYKMVLTAGGTPRNRVNDPKHPDDFYDVVSYKRKIVAFYSLGDYLTFSANDFYDYANQKCDILVCSCSTNKPMVYANNALNRYNTTRINKTDAPNKRAEKATNVADALVVIGMI